MRGASDFGIFPAPRNGSASALRRIPGLKHNQATPQVDPIPPLQEGFADGDLVHQRPQARSLRLQPVAVVSPANLELNLREGPVVEANGAGRSPAERDDLPLQGQTPASSGINDFVAGHAAGLRYGVF